MRRILPLPHHRLHLIPNFCRWQAILQLAFVMELVAVVLTLGGGARGEAAQQQLLLLSLYLQWIGFCSAAALCWARRWLRVARPAFVFIFCWGMIVLIVMVIADASYFIAGQLGISRLMSQETRLEFIARHTLVAAIVALLLLRYFWSHHDWQQGVRAEGESRYQALNARIRPHFLFNALNSLAALVHTRPNEAEIMVEDLSDLFRASLEKRGQVGPLSDEVALCNAYLRIEQLRLGEKLAVDWDVPEPLLAWPMPMLMVQPLVENAVHHGVSKTKDGGAIRITAREIDKRLVVEVENPLPADDGRTSHGNRIAVDNIAQRLNLIYGDAARLELGRDMRLEGPVFRARLVLPKEPKKESGES
jgi:two-component system, LytTR family, sensor histidine kinase AlgZ